MNLVSTLRAGSCNFNLFFLNTLSLSIRSYYYFISDDLVPKSETTSRFQSSSIPSVRAKIQREYLLSPLIGEVTSCCIFGFFLPPNHLWKLKPQLSRLVSDIFELPSDQIALGSIMLMKAVQLQKEEDFHFALPHLSSGEPFACSEIEIFLPELFSHIDIKRYRNKMSQFILELKQSESCHFSTNELRSQGSNLWKRSRSISWEGEMNYDNKFSGKSRGNPESNLTFEVSPNSESSLNSSQNGRIREKNSLSLWHKLHISYVRMDSKTDSYPQLPDEWGGEAITPEIVDSCLDRWNNRL